MDSSKIGIDERFCQDSNKLSLVIYMHLYLLTDSTMVMYLAIMAVPILHPHHPHQVVREQRNKTNIILLSHIKSA